MAQEKRDVALEMMEEEIPETSEGRREKLSEMFTQAEDTAKQVKTDTVLNKQRLEAAKMEMLRGFMGILEKFNVDPTDLESITQFLEEVEKTDPELFDLFEAVFSSIETVGQPIPGREVVEEGVEEEVEEETPEPRAEGLPRMPGKRLSRAVEQGMETPPAPPSPGGRRPSSFTNLMGGMS